jgi:hypothetical protein
MACCLRVIACSYTTIVTTMVNSKKYAPNVSGKERI